MSDGHCPPQTSPSATVEELQPCDLCSVPDALVGVCIFGIYDGVLFWRCGACGRAQARSDGPMGKRRAEIAQMYVWQINAAVEDAQRFGRAAAASDHYALGEGR